MSQPTPETAPVFMRGNEPAWEYGCGCTASALRMQRCPLHEATPELLEALKTILDDVEHSWLTFSGRLEQVKETARAAIAKTRGNS